MKATASRALETRSQVVDRKPYPKYNATGSEWIAQIPEHWEIRKLKYVCDVQFSSVDKHSAEGEEDVLLCNYTDVYNNDLITPELSFMKATASRYEACRFRLCEGDVLVTKDSESWDDIAVPAYVTANMDMVLCGYHLAQIRPYKPVCDGKYLFYSFVSANINHQFRIAANGITRYGLGKYWLDNGLFLVPPIDEQRSIADFLDRETEKINELIAKKQRLIARLEEKRTALISEAVTRGLNPNTPMKDSGVEWIGEIPEHWEVKKLKYAARFVSGGTPDTDKLDYWDGPIPWVSPKDMQSDFVSDSQDHITVQAVAESATTLVAVSSLLVVVRSGILRHTIPAAVNLVPVTINQDIRGVLPDYALIQAEYVLRLIQGKENVLLTLWRKQGATVESLEYDLLANTLVPLPPLSEQTDICRKVRAKVEQIDALIGQNQKTLAVLREYRTSTITSAVTGQVDVRQSATQSKGRSANPYFKRSVLAAEIIHQLHREPTFGHVKFQKLFFLIEHEVEATDLDTHYTRQAAGPLDRKLLFSIDKQLQQQKWYKPVQSQGRHMYVPMENAANHRKYYETHWSAHDATIQRIISLFRIFDTERCEIVATLYAAWNDLLLSGQSPTDVQIVDEVVNHWHEKKQRIERNRWMKALQWMRDNNLVPKGVGTATQRS